MAGRNTDGQADQIERTVRVERVLPPVNTQDVIVVGGGMAGLAVYVELLSVGINDALVVNADRKLNDAADSGWMSTNQHYADPPGLDWKLGGRAQRWHGVVLPIEAPALDSWPAQIRDKLTESRPGPGGYRSVLHIMKNWKELDLDAPANETEDFLKEQLADFEVAPRASFSCTDGTHRTWTSFTPFDALSNDPRFTGRAEAERLSVLDATRVLAIGQHRGHLRVHCQTATSIAHLDARAVVLSAGALESTRIMAQSQTLIGPQRPTWGNLATKIKHGYVAVPPGWMTERWRRGDRVLLVNRRPDLQANLFIEIVDDGFESPLMELWWMAEQSVTECANITFLPSPDPYDLAACPARINAEIGHIDLGLIHARNLVTVDVLRALGCVDIAPPSPSQAVRYRNLVRADVAVVSKATPYLNPLGYSDHESCTLAIGTEVNTDFMSYQIPGLFVAGPAIFPRTGAANPGLTVLATARQIAPAIRAYLECKS